jgi:hypothetical protein
VSRVIALTVVAAATGCSLGQFEELRDRAWADSSGTPTGIDGAYPVAIAALVTDRPGLHAVAVASSPLGLATISYNTSGTIETRGISLEVGAVGPPTVAAATDPVTGADGAVVVGVGGESLLLYDARTGLDGPELRRVIDADDCAAGLTGFGHHTVYTLTDLGDPDQPDLVVSAGNELIAYPDLTPTSSASCIRCTVPPSGGIRPIRSIVALELSDSYDGRELVIGVDTGVIVFAASWILNQCTSNSVTFGDIPIVESGLEFGKAIAVGDEDLPLHKLAIWAPASARVYVYRGLGTSGPVTAANVASLVVDGATPSFGSSLAFADVDRDGTDELVIGDPDATVDGVRHAGRATVFKPNPTDPFEYERLADAYDARPETEQRFGRVLTTAEFVGSTDDTDTLLIGAAYELFTYFRIVDEMVDPRE